MCVLLKSPREKSKMLLSCSALLVFAMIVWSAAASKGGKVEMSAQGGGKDLLRRDTPPPKGMEGRVVGGVVSRKNQFPYLIAITDWGISCGGSLIKESVVLTAAHCWVNSETGKVNDNWHHIRVIAGEHNLENYNEGFEQFANVKRVVVHKDFDGVHYVNDIALIEVSTPFNLSDVVKTVKLATRTSKYRESDCTVVGWGYTHAVTEADQFKPKLQPFPDTLNFVQLDIIKKNECTKIDKSPELAHQSTLCAAKLAGGKGTCVGDSGGPLTCPSIPSGEPLQVGVVSGAQGCAQPKSPGLFADVAFMEAWVAKALKTLKESKETIIRI